MLTIPPAVSGPDEKIPPAPGTNQIAGFVEYRPLAYWEKKEICFIDQAWGQDGWILAKFFFCVFMDRDEVEVHKNAKNERGQHPAILTEKAWSIKDH